MNLFATPHHLCLVVHDAAATAAFYESVGIGPWRDYPPLAAYAELGGIDPDAFRALTFKVAAVGALQLQLCQPGPQDSPQRHFLDTRGEGVFHLGFDVAKGDAGEREGLAAGLTVLMRGRRADRSGFTFFDTTDQAGVVLAIRSAAPPLGPSSDR